MEVETEAFLVLRGNRTEQTRERLHRGELSRTLVVSMQAAITLEYDSSRASGSRVFWSRKDA